MSGRFNHVLVSKLIQPLKDVLAYNLRNCWRSFIHQLGKEFSDKEIERICRENEDIYEQSFQAFHHWCEINPLAQWKDIRRVLQIMDQIQLVVDCEKEFEGRIPIDKKNEEFQNKLELASEDLRTIYKDIYTSMEVLEHNSTDKKHVTMRDVYVDLKINSSENENWRKFVDRDCYISQRKNCNENKLTKDFFKGDDRLVIVSGIAGIGKTTVLLHSLMEWVERKQWIYFDFVFHIQLREVNFLNDCSSAEALLKECFPTVMKKISFTELMSIADHVLFVVDGLDEFRFIEDLLKISRGGSDVEPIAKALNGILNQKHLPVKSRLLLAGRPEAASKIKCMLSIYSPLCVDVIGFSENSVQQYIAKRAGDKVELKSIITDTIARSPSMQIMATVPIYLEVMCSILESDKDTTFSTLTELYTWSLLYFVKKHFRDKGETRFIDMPIQDLLDESGVMETIYFVCKMAYQMLKEGRIVFDSKSFGKIPGDSLENCGLVTKVNLTQLKGVYQFRHLSVMEFCSAVYIINNLSDKVDSVINDPRLEGCISIVCGLEGARNNNPDTPPNIVEMFVEALKLERRPSSWLHYLIEQNEDIYIEDMGDLFFTSFFEAQSPIPQQYERHFTRRYKYWINDRNAIRRSQCLYFADQLMKAGCLNIRWLRVDCGKQMSRDLQARLMKLMCIAKVIEIFELPVNFNVELFAQIFSRRSSSEPPIDWLEYYHRAIKTFRMLLPVMDVVEELNIHLLIECSVDETIEIINVMKSMKSVKRIMIVDWEGVNKQHEHVYEAMREELEGLGEGG